MTTVNRKDIELTEEQEYYSFIEAPRVFWSARLAGRLSSKESVDMARSGATAQDALTALETAISEQGWELRDDS